MNNRNKQALMLLGMIMMFDANQGKALVSSSDAVEASETGDKPFYKTIIVGPKKIEEPKQEWEKKKPYGQGDKKNILDYYAEHPELRDQASKSLIKQIPLHELLSH